MMTNGPFRLWTTNCFIDFTFRNTKFVSDHKHETPNHRTKRSVTQDHNPENEDTFWNFGAQLILQDRLVERRNTNVAKNIILFVGDGMSLSTVAAARTYLGKAY